MEVELFNSIMMKVCGVAIAFYCCVHIWVGIYMDNYLIVKDEMKGGLE